MLTSATVSESGENIALVFTEVVEQQTNGPPASAFAVTVDGSALTVTDVLPSNEGEGLIAVAPPIKQGQAVVVTYTDPTTGDDANAIQDDAGNDAASFTTGSDGVPAVTNESTVATKAPANWSLTPTGLATGAKFRLLFLSSTKRDALSTDIADYNTFVQGRAAAGHADIQAYSAGFRAVGCTSDTDARDNTLTTFTGDDKGVPIYWLDGAKAAADYEDFYDGSWDDEVSDKNESGADAHDTSQEANFPATGCKHDGTEAFRSSAETVSRGLGATAGFMRLGRPNSSGNLEGPIDGNHTARTDSDRPMYGLSTLFEVDATPPALTRATVDDTGLVVELEFSEHLQTKNLPPASAFTVTADGTAVTVSAVTKRKIPDVFQISVSPHITLHQAVVLAYADPTTGNDAKTIQDAVGNDARDFTTGRGGVPDVINNSAVAAAVPANWALTPTGLTVGAKFRLVFLSSTRRDALSPDIADYNTFVQDLATAGHAAIQAYSAGFRVVGCTEDTDARDNTSTTFTETAKGVPTYWLNGAKAADDYEDFYDGSWDDEVNDKNEFGTDAHDTDDAFYTPFTGCRHPGTEAFGLNDSRALGNSLRRSVTVGLPGSRDRYSVPEHGPISSRTIQQPDEILPMYGLSQVLQVAAAVTVNTPPAFSPATAVRSLAENTAAGQNVGAALTATDADSHTLIYTLGGADAASFDVVTISASAQVRTKTGVTYNHEAKSSYTVMVTASDGAGGTATVTVTITVTDVDEPPGRPAAPSVTAAAESTTSLDVTWTAPSNTGPAITSYDLQYRQGSSGNFTDGPQDVTGTSAAIGSLAPVTSYQVQVRATNAEGDGAWSFSGTGQTKSVPGAPTNLSAAAGGNTRINLSWTAPASTGGSPITGYRIESSPNGTSNWTTLVADTTNTNTTYAHTGLPAGVTRHYRVSAINTNGAGLPSNVDDATTAPSVPGAPSNLSATASGSTRIDLTWTAPASDGDSPITGYKIEVSSDGGSNWTTLVADTTNTNTTYAHTGLPAGVTRHYRVSAINAVGTGLPSDTAGTTTGSTVPDAPTSLTATAGGSTQINLSWTAPGSDGGSPITGYKIESSPNGTSNWTNLVVNTRNTNTTYSDTGLLGGTTRHYRVSAINANGTGTPSNVDNATTAASVPGAPSDLSARESGTSRINLSWSAPASDGGSAITGYKIEFSSDGGSSWTNLVANTGNPGTTYSDTGLSSSTTRHYRLSAINTHGTGATSNVASASTGLRTVRFEADLYTATEGGAAATVAVVLSAAAAQTVTIPLTTERLSGATAEDYSGVPEGVTFAAGQARQTFTVAATDDRDEDGLKRLRLRFGTTLPSRYVPGSPRTAIVRLVDNDDGGLLVNFGTERHTTVKVRESDTVRHRFTVNLNTNRYGPPDGNPQQPLTIPLVVTHQGGATEEDYTPGIPADVTFAVGQSEASFSMRAIPDGKREPGEGLRIDFGELPPGVTRGDWGPYETVEFVDQVLPEYTAWFGAEEYTATEGGAAAGVSIHLSAEVIVEPAEVRLQREYGGGATEDDHESIPTVVTFAVGDRTKTITVTATDDTDDDDGESVTLSFVNDPNDGVSTGNGPNSATVALEDNDGAERVTVSFGAVTYTATEGGSGATVSLELDAAPGRSLTVPLTKAHLGGTTPADYSGIPGSVAFTANQTATTFTVTATADQIDDGGESVSIGFGTLPEGVFAGSPAAAAVTLADGSEQRFEVSFSSANVQVREGARRLRLSVQLGNRYQPASGNPQRPVTIPLVVTPVGGATAADYAGIPQSVTFAEGQGSAPYYVQALPDEEDETGEGLRLDFGPLPPGVTKGDYRPSQTIDFVDAGAAAANLSVAGRLLTLGYPGALDGGSTPSGGDFVVLAEAPRGQQAMVAVTAVSVRGSDVLLELDRPVAPDETVTLSYLAAAMHPIRDAAGLSAPPLADEPVRNDTGASETAIPAPMEALLDAAPVGAGTERLDLSSRNLTDLSALAGLSGLRELDLRDNAIADLSPLAGLTGLQLLYLSGNRIEELWPLAGLTALEQLNLSDNRIADLSPLAGLSGLQVLDLAGNRIEELWPLAGLTALERLNLSDNRIEDLWPLAGLSGLQVLLLDRNRVADVSALSPLAELANLGLSGNRIADIGRLSELGRLRRLDLSGNAVANLSALGDVSGLVWLRLPGNPVSDVAPLGRLEQLLWLWLDPGTAAGMEALAPPAGHGAAQLWIELTPAQ